VLPLLLILLLLSLQRTETGLKSILIRSVITSVTFNLPQYADEQFKGLGIDDVRYTTIDSESCCDCYVPHSDKVARSTLID
jgi:hypothetical protein